MLICRFVVAVLVLLIVCGLSVAGEVDFRNDIIPVLTKSGCNAGACHGAALGRGGFKLSLYGGNPDADYDAIVHHLQGRRVNLSRPERSLVFLKPTQSIEHEGGLRFDEDSEAGRRLIDWIRAGATNRSARQLQRVEVAPTSKIVDISGQPVQLRSHAYYDDGSSNEVTQWTIFTPEDKAAVRVDSKTASATVLRRGRHVVVARYLDQVVPIELIVPLASHAKSIDVTPANMIDKAIFKKLSQLQLPLSDPASESEFIRRLSIDLTGRLPTTDQALATGTSTRNDHSQKMRRIDELLSSDAFAEYWTLKLSRWLRMKSPASGKEATQGGRALDAYHQWLNTQVKTGVGYDEIARALVLASGDTTQIGQANFYRTAGGPREQAEFFSELFMGSRLRCANCHNHPLDRWTQDDYHGLAAIFAKVDAGVVVAAKPRGEVIHPRTLEPAIPRIPGEGDLPTSNDDDREHLAQWLTAGDNPYFAKAIVNRLWKSMMGRGLVEPVDDFRATNPSTHPELLNQLAADFRDHGYDLRRTLKLIASSQTYARSANAVAGNEDDTVFYSHFRRRVLEPEVLADAISDVVGVSEKYGSNPNGTRAVTLVNPNTPSLSLDILGRCDRKESCESSSAPVGGLPQKLHLFNGKLLNARIRVNGSRLDRLLREEKTTTEIVEAFYLAAFSRTPSETESKHWCDIVSKTNSDQDQSRHAVLEDFVWAVLTSHEFRTNH